MHLVNHNRPWVKPPVCLQAAALAVGLHTTLLECVADSHALLMMHSFRAAQQSGPAAVAVTASGMPRSPAAARSCASTSRSKLPFPRIPGSGAAVHAIVCLAPSTHGSRCRGCLVFCRLSQLGWPQTYQPVRGARAVSAC